jgi:hypothetical protein
MRRTTSCGDWAISIYDRVYRFCHGLDRAHAAVPPLLRVEVRRSRRRLRLSDGVTIRPGDRVGVLHLDNAAVAALHDHGLRPVAVGLEFRRQMLASMHRLAARARDEGGIVDVVAFSAVTIFYRPLQRLGFEVEAAGLWWPRLTGVYQGRLLATLHPDGWQRLARMPTRRAERLWLSRHQLIARYDGATSPVSAISPRAGDARLREERRGFPEAPVLSTLPAAVAGRLPASCPP